MNSWKCKYCNKEILPGNVYAKVNDYILCIPCYDKQNNENILKIDLENIRPRSVFNLEHIRLEIKYFEMKNAKIE